LENSNCIVAVFADEKFKTEKEAANITGKWGCFLQKWEYK
jgi:hypothetical protein